MPDPNSATDPDVPNPDFWIIPDPARLEALAEFAAGAGHEINNPLATIIGRAQMLLKGEPDPQRRALLQSIGAQAYRIRDMIGDTMVFGRPPRPELQDISLAAVVNRVAMQQADSLAACRCTIRTEIAPALHLRADPTQLEIVLIELIRNSRQAMPDGGEICVIADVPTSSQEMAHITLRDSGIGFRPQERMHAFDPFFSGRQAGRGLGFGLPKCWQILNSHGGSLAIESPAGGPTSVHLYWPVSVQKDCAGHSV